MQSESSLYTCSTDESSILVWNEESAGAAIKRDGCSATDRILTVGMKLVNNDGDGDDGAINCVWLNYCLVLVGCRRSLQVFCIDGNESLCESGFTGPYRLRNFVVTSSDATVSLRSGPAEANAMLEPQKRGTSWSSLDRSR